MQINALTSFPTSVALLIPAWQPPDSLPNLVCELIHRGCGNVVVVDDGSSMEKQAIFRALSQMPQVEVTHHAENTGKGSALKTGFRHLLTRRSDCIGVVTADADGQHTAADIARVAHTLADASRFVLGTRGFDRNVPLRSKFGNALTQRLFYSLTGSSVSDTQTGLRGFPLPILPELIDLPGDRYEYEMTVLAHLCQTMRAPLEIPISTIYLDGNRSSHFDPFRDSLRIYSVLLRLAMQKSSLASLTKEHAAY